MTDNNCMVYVSDVLYNYDICTIGVDTSITLDAAKWNSAGAEVSSCVIALFYWIMYYNILNTFGTNLPVYFLSFCLMYLYICLCFLCIVIGMHRFIQHVYLKHAIV